MSEEENAEPESVGRLTGKTTVHTVQAIITNPKIQRNSYFTIYGSCYQGLQDDCSHARKHERREEADDAGI